MRDTLVRLCALGGRAARWATPRAKPVATAVAVCLVGCSTPPPAVDRHGTLLTLAAGEAGQIVDPTDRLKRQLNLADRQLDDGHKDAARGILANAGGTLRSAAKPTDMSPRVRIAGWVSISELSRRADNPTAANVACDAAVATLRTLDAVAERPEYAVGVSNEVRALRGKPAAAAILRESADWVKAITDKAYRREALVALADATFECDAFDAGLAELRQDPDPVWRSDTLAMLAGQGQLEWVSSVGNGAVPGSVEYDARQGGHNSGRFSQRSVTQGFLDPSEMTPRSPPPATRPFGQSVDYRSVFGSGTR